MINRVVLVGRVANDSELKYSRDGLPISAFSLSLGRPGACEFMPIVMFRKLAEATSKHLLKGRLVGVEGRISSRAYETTEGEKRRVIEVIADRLRFLDPPLVLGDDEDRKAEPRGATEA
ncbi:MAG: single-stranded DNA-binding protein [Thermaerobacter sp.]|nr:single-stranded DNA-binding protein [Thermaerobacter sp.]